MAINLTPHQALCKRGAHYLKSKLGCVFAVWELVATSSEQPDAIGWQAWRSWVIEVKLSRSDFHRDKKKHHRQDPNGGMGNSRYYLCPEGLIKPDELPAGWGLLYATDKRIYQVAPAIWRSLNESTAIAERNMLVSIMRRSFEKCQYLEAKIYHRKPR